MNDLLKMRSQLRCITAHDCCNMAINFGAKKVNILPGVQYGSERYFADLVTLIVYPGEIATLINEAIVEWMSPGTRLDVRPAEIIPINGEIDVQIVPSLSNTSAFNIAAEAIQNNINPPFGHWGDRRLPVSLATALENQPNSICKVPGSRLKRSDTDEALETLTIQPWNLFEIQQDVVFNWLR